jgi:hypothetical protein
MLITFYFSLIGGLSALSGAIAGLLDKILKNYCLFYY